MSRRLRAGRGVLVAVLGFAGAAALAVSAWSMGTSLVPFSSRPYRLGFIRWPVAGLFTAGAPEAALFIKAHADLMCHHLESGVPWPEALVNGPFPDALMQDWKTARANTPTKHQVFVATTPMDGSRPRLALYWGDRPNQPLPPPWDALPLNDPNVKIAYLNYLRRAIDFFRPKYVVIGIEVNLALLQDRAVWEQYLDLHRYVYTTLKRAHPKLQIFASVQYNIVRVWSQSDASRESQARELGRLLPYCDLLGLSLYPYGGTLTTPEPKPVPEDYFDAALTFGKPLAVTETGYPSQGFVKDGHQYTFSPSDQFQYIGLLLRKANEHNFAFIVNNTPLDFDQYLPALPAEIQNTLIWWAYGGLQDSQGKLKAAAYLWDEYLKLPKR